MRRMEADGRTTVIYVADEGTTLKEILALIKELGETPTFDIPLRLPRPSNERPWHKHTLPSRRRR